MLDRWIWPIAFAVNLIGIPLGLPRALEGSDYSLVIMAFRCLVVGLIGGYWLSGIAEETQ